MVNPSKLGLIFPYTTKLIGTKSHCQAPCPVHVQDDVYRIFFGSRDPENNTLVFYFDLDLSKLKVISFSRYPVLSNGAIGYFDSNGIYPSCVIKKDGVYWMYTIGYTRGEAPIWYARIGLARSPDGRSFEKYSNAPLLNTSEHDPWMLTGPFVLEDSGIFRMWYVSGFNWDSKMNSYYHIKYAESIDAINWSRNGIVSIGHRHPGEKNIARPWVLKENNIYKAWYSYNCGDGYRIGYAESMDGITFDRMDHKAGVHLSNEPWENKAVAYPAVVVHEDKKYMFYNGNNFGKDGIALALLE